MAVEDYMLPYELLVRYGETGEIQGTHHIQRHVIKVDGVKIKDDIGHAQPVALENLTGLLDAAASQALVDNQSLREQLSSAENQIESLEAQVAELANRLGKPQLGEAP